MKKNSINLNLDNKRTEKFAVLTLNEMMQIKGGGKDGVDPPVAK
jgi:hypothetical protein